MKKSSFLCICIIGVFIYACCPAEHEVFLALDEAIEKQALYDKQFELRQGLLREEYDRAKNDSAKWEAAYALENTYYIHDVDSCEYYIHEMKRLQGQDLRHQIITAARYAQTLYRLDSLQKALQVLDEYDLPLIKSADTEIIIAFCRSSYQIYRDVRQREKFKDVVNLWWQTDSTNSGAIFNHDVDLRRNGQYAEAIRNISKSVCHSQRDTAVLYYYLARLHAFNKNTDQAIKYYSKSAEYDMYVSGKNYESLLQLSRLLFETGDIRRAEHYMRIALADAKASNWTKRYQYLLDSEFVILNTMLSQEAQKRRANLIAMIAVTLLLVISVILLVFIARQSNRLSSSKKKLQEVSNIKDKFLARYMESCVDYLNKVDEYRSTLRGTMKDEGLEAVRALLRKPSFAAGEFNSLLQEFDSTFLAIFPDFVDKVNANMQEGYHLTEPSSGTLSTELRILALIRMGISKRKRIARILNMSVDTVYVYHSNLQKHSLHTNASFDSIIAGL